MPSLGRKRVRSCALNDTGIIKKPAIPARTKVVNNCFKLALKAITKMIITPVMKHKFTSHLQILMLAAVLMLAPAFTLKAQTSPDFEISKNLEILSTLYKELNTNYVDGVNPSDLMKTGIDAMLDKLDPYTVYIPESEIEDYRFMTTGEYGGIG